MLSIVCRRRMISERMEVLNGVGLVRLVASTHHLNKVLPGVDVM